jgi:hypothetical protein
VVPAGPGVELRPAGPVLSPPLPLTGVADADGVTVADGPGEEDEAVEVASAWVAGDSDAEGALAARRWDVAHAGMSMTRRTGSAAAGPILVMV